MRLLSSVILRAALRRPNTFSGNRAFCGGPPTVDRVRMDAANSIRPVNLSYDMFDGKEKASPLILLHGLFGRKSNFNSIAKSLAQRTGRTVVTVDARNHGKSEHNPVLTYEAMANDLKQLLGQLHFGKCVLIGHSMGGKVAMTTALSVPSLVERLVVVDICPSPTSSHTDFRVIIKAMKEVKIPNDTPRLTARRLAEDQMREQVQSIRQFLLNNLMEEDGIYSWRVNLDAISTHLEDIMGFPQFDTTYEGPTLFIAGSNSPYLSSEDYPEIQHFFPYADVQFINDAGHWVHADKPHEFISSIQTFLQS